MNIAPPSPEAKAGGQLDSATGNVALVDYLANDRAGAGANDRADGPPIRA